MQKGSKSIQGELLDACRELFGSDSIDLFGAGRTDSGVHAIGQVAHLEAQTDLPLIKIKYGINDRLPPYITVVNVEEAHPKFHARYDANARSYIYQISRRRTAFGKKYVWWIKDELDIDKMKSAAKLFVGFKDFKSFSDKNNIAESSKVSLESIEILHEGDLILIRIRASHFLWKMVRRIVGLLAETGRGKMNEKEIELYFKKYSNEPSKYTAPPSGLFLEKVYY